MCEGVKTRQGTTCKFKEFSVPCFQNNKGGSNLIPYIHVYWYTLHLKQVIVNLYHVGNKYEWASSECILSRC